MSLLSGLCFKGLYVPHALSLCIQMTKWITVVAYVWLYNT